ncbi:hypothetical protein BGW80DRAFT_1333642 [Lactifluus volemus]|nr:hypothetical protein BGW80DRAFT_1333642 [Lactifluus volemus]
MSVHPLDRPTPCPPLQLSQPELYLPAPQFPQRALPRLIRQPQSLEPTHNHEAVEYTATLLSSPAAFTIPLPGTPPLS